jgi:ABC-type transport system involved in cytochrome c biogenesis permease subunit
MTGSLRKVEGLKAGKDAQDQATASNVVAQTVYSSVLLVSALKAPASGTKVIHVKDATGFSVGNTVYVVSDSQDEITTTITAISVKMITLGANVPAKYRQNEGARLYKVL